MKITYHTPSSQIVETVAIGLVQGEQGPPGPGTAEALAAAEAAQTAATTATVAAARLDALGIGIQSRDRLLMGNGQWAPRFIHDAVADDPHLVFVADWTRGGALALGHGTMEDAITVTRATPGRYLDGAGIWRLFPADTRRVGNRGLLVEPGAANLLRRSLELDHAAWTRTRSVLTPSGATIAGLPAFKLDADLQAGAHQLQNSSGMTTAAASTYTLSVHAAAAEMGYLHIIVAGAAFAVQHRMSFDLTTGTAAAQAGTPTGRATQVDGGWRCEMTAPTSAGGNSFVYFVAAESPTVFSSTQTEVGRGIYLAGAQFEAGGGATSLIETADASGSRAADIVSLLPGWWPTAEGAVYLAASGAHRPAAYLLGANGSAASPLIMGDADTRVRASADGGALVGQAATTQWARGTVAEMVSAWSADGRAIAFKGAAATSDAVAPPAVPMAFLGSRGADVAGEMFVGHIRALRVWNKRLGAA